MELQDSGQGGRVSGLGMLDGLGEDRRWSWTFWQGQVGGVMMAGCRSGSEKECGVGVLQYACNASNRGDEIISGCYIRIPKGL